MSPIEVRQALNHLGNSVRLYRSLLTKYLDRYSNLYQDMNTLYQAKQFVELERFVHSIKGLAGNLGATGLRELCMDLDDVLKNELERKDLKAIDLSVSDTIKQDIEVIRLKSLQTNKVLREILEMSDEQLLKLDIYPQLGNPEEVEYINQNVALNLLLLKLVDVLKTHNYEYIRNVVTSIKELEVEGLSFWIELNDRLEAFDYDYAVELIKEKMEA